MAKARRKSNRAKAANSPKPNGVLQSSKKVLAAQPISGVEAPPAFVPIDQRQSAITPERVEWWKRSRFTPIRLLTPELVSRQLDDFNAGYLRQFALTMDAIERRDDKLSSVIPKRKAGVTRHSYQILIDEVYEDDPEAQAHKEVLEYFWSHAEATNAVDLNERGSFGKLVEQMMDALAKRYAAHELLWRPSPQGLTCTFNFVPLWFFENLRGRLCFLKNDLDYYGVPLDPGAWMISSGPGLMEACTVAYMFKRLPMQDWLRYCEKHSMPGILGKTNASTGTPQWNAMRDAVSAVATDFSAVISKEEEIDKIDFAADGQLPYERLVDRMDRAIVEIWRGGDLATMSHQGEGQGTGASLQEQETDSLENGDAKFVSETLNMQIERRVIEYHFGIGTQPKAYLKIVIPSRVDTTKEIQVDTFLTSHGAPVSLPEAMERYGRAIPKKGDEVLSNPLPPTGSPTGAQNGSQGNRGAGNGRLGAKAGGRFAANEAITAEYGRQIIETARDRLAQEQAAVLEPLRRRLEGILAMPNEQTFKAAVGRLRRDLPSILEEINQDPSNAGPIAEAMASFFFNKLAEGAVRAQVANTFDPDEPRDDHGKWTEEGGDAPDTAPGWEERAFAKIKKAMDKSGEIGDSFHVYHGTTDSFIKNIQKEGLQPGKKQIWGDEFLEGPAHNTAAKWGANKIAMMEQLAKNGEWAKLKAMDTVPKSEQPNKYQKAVHEAYQKLTAQPTPAVAPVAAAAAGKAEVSTAGWKKIGGQLGSNAGGIYQDENGQKWYVKHSKSDDHALNEKLASELYKAAGAPVPTIKLADVGGGKLGIASKWEDTSYQFDPNNKDHAKAAQENFAAHAWLGNWDAVGLNNDNQFWTKKAGEYGKLNTIDVGGSLLYRAQGEPKGKAFGINANEWDNLRNKSIAPQSAAVFGSMTANQLSASADKIALVSDKTIHDLVQKYGPGDSIAKGGLALTIQARRDDVKNRAAALLMKHQSEIIEKPAPALKIEVHQPKNAGEKGPEQAVKVPPPPQVQTKANPGAQPKLNSIHAAALTGQIAAVESIYTNPSTKNIYGKKAHEYKQQVLAAMQAGGKAEASDSPVQPTASGAPSHLKAAGGKISLKLSEHELPPEPDFVSKNQANVAQNKSVVAQIKSLAMAGKIDELKALPESPSPKVNQYKQGILGAFHEKLNPPLPDTSAKKFTGAITELDAHAPVVKDISAGYKVGYYVVAGQPGVFYHGYGSGKQQTATTIKADEHYAGFSALTSKEKQLIQSHTGGGYGKFNPKYWQGVPGTDEEALSKALLKSSQTLPEGALLHRKINVDSSVIQKLKNSVGKVIQEPANASTSITSHTWHGNVHLHIIAGPGAKGLYVGPRTSGPAISQHPHENEVILPANTRMLVQKVELNGPNQANVHVLMLPTVKHQQVEAKHKS